MTKFKTVLLLLLNSLLGRNKNGNSLPKKRDEILVEDFAEYFSKIKKIRISLENYPIYDVHKEVNISFKEFRTISDKWCEIDAEKIDLKSVWLGPFPRRLKRAMESSLKPLYTHIINK